MIENVTVAHDAAGFPIVTWSEFRGASAPEGPGMARVECRIMKDAETGTLLFVARGSKGRGGFEAGKPWEFLNGVSIIAAERLYYTKAELELRRHLAGKGVGSKYLWTDNGQVLLAEFRGDTPLHLNYVEASPDDIDHLHLALLREFVTNKDQLVLKLCKVMFLWPTADDKVVTYDPKRIDAKAAAHQRYNLIANVLIGALVIVAGGALVLWLMKVI